MTSRERVLAALRRQKPDRVPVTLYDEVIGYAPEVLRVLTEKCGGIYPGDYFQCDVRAAHRLPTKLQTDFPLVPDVNTRVDEWGVGWRSGGFMHYAEILHPLQNHPAEAVYEYPFPDVDAAYRYEGLRAKVAALHERGLAVTGYPGLVFERAWYLRGMTELFGDLVDNPEAAHYLLDQITNRVLGAARHLASADVDVLILGDDIAGQQGMLMSLPMWRRVFKPRLIRIIQAAKEVKPDLLIFYHSDGNVWDAIPDFIEAGVEVLNPVQPECMDPAAVKKTFGDRLAFFGTVSVQRTLPFGTPAEVREEVRQRIQTVGRNGGLLLAPAHILQPDVPWENVVAFFAAARELSSV